jgi:hypothetical protein
MVNKTLRQTRIMARPFLQTVSVILFLKRGAVAMYLKLLQVLDGGPWATVSIRLGHVAWCGLHQFQCHMNGS